MYFDLDPAASYQPTTTTDVRIYDLTDLNTPHPPLIFHIKCGCQVHAEKTGAGEYDFIVVCPGPSNSRSRCHIWDFRPTVWNMSYEATNKTFFRIPKELPIIDKLAEHPKGYYYTRPATPLELLEYYRRPKNS